MVVVALEARGRAGREPDCCGVGQQRRARCDTQNHRVFTRFACVLVSRTPVLPRCTRCRVANNRLASRGSVLPRPACLPVPPVTYGVSRFRGLRKMPSCHKRPRGVNISRSMLADGRLRFSAKKWPPADRGTRRRKRSSWPRLDMGARRSATNRAIPWSGCTLVSAHSEGGQAGRDRPKEATVLRRPCERAGASGSRKIMYDRYNRYRRP